MYRTQKKKKSWRSEHPDLTWRYICQSNREEKKSYQRADKSGYGKVQVIQRNAARQYNIHWEVARNTKTSAEVWLDSIQCWDGCEGCYFYQTYNTKLKKKILAENLAFQDAYKFGVNIDKKMLAWQQAKINTMVYVVREGQESSLVKMDGQRLGIIAIIPKGVSKTGLAHHTSCKEEFVVDWNNEWWRDSGRNICENGGLSTNCSRKNRLKDHLVLMKPLKDGCRMWWWQLIHFPIPTSEQLRLQFVGSDKYPTYDINHEFHQLKIDEQ